MGPVLGCGVFLGGFLKGKLFFFAGGAIGRGWGLRLSFAAEARFWLFL